MNIRRLTIISFLLTIVLAPNYIRAFEKPLCSKAMGNQFTRQERRFQSNMGEIIFRPCPYNPKMVIIRFVDSSYLSATATQEQKKAWDTAVGKINTVVREFDALDKQNDGLFRTLTDLINRRPPSKAADNPEVKALYDKIIRKDNGYFFKNSRSLLFEYQQLYKTLLEIYTNVQLKQ